jgi:hypothetical protein
VTRDRFVSLGASFDGGEIVTKPLLLEGAQLRLNAKAAFGEIAVDVLDAKGAVIARSEPIRSDSLDIPVRWRQGGLPKGAAPVTLRITLRNALLFALWSA